MRPFSQLEIAGHLEDVCVCINAAVLMKKPRFVADEAGTVMEKSWAAMSSSDPH